jgi:ABC-2 type transport system ATP-binding protein
VTATVTSRASDSPPGEAQPALHARDLTYLHGPGRGIDHLSLAVSRGSTLGLIGPNGSGKSTFFMLLAGFLEPQSGTLQLLGGLPNLAAAKLGWVFQEPSLDPLLTVDETLALGGRLYGAAHSSSQQALAVVGLTDRRRDRVGTLSGGMRRRLELARAVQHSPELLIMDEPTLGLDLGSRRAIWEHLGRLNADGLTVIVATNDVAEAERYCTEIAFLRDGQLIAQGSPAELKLGLREQSLRVRWPGISETDFDQLSELDGVSGARRSGDLVQLTTSDGRSLLRALAGLPAAGIEAIEIHDTSLEDAYFQLSGTSLREGKDER